jgi:hypothetical protein
MFITMLTGGRNCSLPEASRLQTTLLALILYNKFQYYLSAYALFFNVIAFLQVS